MSTTGGFLAGSIVAKLLLDKSGWNASVKSVATDQRMMTSHFGKIGASAQMIGVMVAAAAAATVVALGAIVKKTAEAGDQLYEMAQKTGISVEILSSYKLAAEKAGSSLEGLAVGIRFLSRNMFDAGRGVKLTQQYFDQLGISTEEWKHGLPGVNDVLLKIADRFAGMADGAEKNALAIKVLGRSGTELIPFLNLGSEGLREEAELAKKLGIVFTEKTAKAAHELSHTLKDLSAGGQGLRNTIGNALIPIVNEMGRHVVDVLILLQEKIKEFADSGELREWAIAAGKAAIHFAKVVVQIIEIVAIAIPSIKAGIGEFLAWTQDQVATVAGAIASLPASVIGPQVAAGYKIMAATALNAAADLRRAAGEQTDVGAKMAAPFEIIIQTLETLADSFGKPVEEAKKAAKGIAEAFDAIALKNKLGLVLKSDVAEKIADITKALEVFKGQLTPETERKLRDDLEALGEEFGFLKEKVGAVFNSDIRKKIEDVEKAMTEFQGRMNPETARRLAEELRHLGDDTDYLRTELGLVFTFDVDKKIDDITLALEKYKGLLTPESERNLRLELALLADQFGYLKTELNLTFSSDLDRQIEDISTSLQRFGGQLSADTAKELKDRLLDLQLARLGVTKNIVDALNGAYGAMASGLADAFEGMLNGTKKFGDAFVAIWTSLKKAFFQVLGEMVAGFMVKFVKQIIAGMSLIKALESALGIGGAVVKVATSAAGGAVGGAIGETMAVGVGGAVGETVGTGAAVTGSGTATAAAGISLGTAFTAAFVAVWAYGFAQAIVGVITWGKKKTAEVFQAELAWIKQLEAWWKSRGLDADAIRRGLDNINWWMDEPGSRGNPNIGKGKGRGAGGGSGAGVKGGINITLHVSTLDSENVTNVVRNKVIPVLREAARRHEFWIPLGSAGGV